MDVAERTIFEIGFEAQKEGKHPVFRGQMARMTRSPFLEAFTKVHPVVPGILFVPVVSAALWFGLQGAAPWIVAAGFAVGFFVWTILEYTLHRWLFHIPSKGPVSGLVYLTFHGVHHMYPDDHYRLVMVPVVSVPLALIFFSLFSVVFPAAWVWPAFAGLTSGYLFYDYSHWATHWARAPKSRLFAPVAGLMSKQRKRHMKHHFGDHDRGFGVSLGFWDHVFGTVDPTLR